jgi:hypothetical protein
MAAECSHQDKSRRTVSATAHAVAVNMFVMLKEYICIDVFSSISSKQYLFHVLQYMRGLEYEQQKENAWFVDPYAIKLVQQ